MKQRPILITATHIRALHEGGHVTMTDYIDAVETAFRGQGRHALEIMPRQVLWRDPEATGVRSPSLKLSASILRTEQVMGASIYAAHFTPGSLNMWIMLFDAESGDLHAILHGRELSLWKTGATGALAAKKLAREDSRVAAIIGTGYFAYTQALGVAAVRPIDTMRCYSRDPDRRTEFASRVARELPGVSVSASDSVEQAVDRADIVVTITTSPDPVLEGRWLAEGVHCNIMGQHDPRTREVDADAVVMSRVVVDSLSQALNEKGELLVPMAQGVITRDHIMGELGDVLCGHVTPRTNPLDRTMFLSGGTALEYLGTCSMLADKARKAGLGQVLDI
jgi:ornithine cyclodeaminase/alanine dehydrogenase-like protein (mu-crystallin family)